MPKKVKSSSELAVILHERFKDMTLGEIARFSGININSLRRILDGEVDPSWENSLRLSFALGIHIGEIFRLAGKPEIAHLCERVIGKETKDRIPTEHALYGPKEVGFHQRLQRLLEWGLDNSVDESLTRLEQNWQVFHPSFLKVAEESKAEAAVLVLNTHRRKGDVLFLWKCTEPTAATLAEGEDVEGWAKYSHRSEDSSVELFLKNATNVDLAQVGTAVALWASGLFSIRKRERNERIL